MNFITKFLESDLINNMNKYTFLDWYLNSYGCSSVFSLLKRYSDYSNID